MKQVPDAAEVLRLRRELEEARERMRLALEHRDSMQRDLDAMSRRLSKQIDRNSEVWLAACRVPGGLEALRSVPWTA